MLTLGYVSAHVGYCCGERALVFEDAFTGVGYLVFPYELGSDCLCFQEARAVNENAIAFPLCGCGRFVRFLLSHFLLFLVPLLELLVGDVFR